MPAATPVAKDPELMKSKSNKTSEVQQKKPEATVATQPAEVSKLKAELEKSNQEKEKIKEDYVTLLN